MAEESTSFDWEKLLNTTVSSIGTAVTKKYEAKLADNATRQVQLQAANTDAPSTTYYDDTDRPGFDNQALLVMGLVGLLGTLLIIKLVR